MGLKGEDLQQGTDYTINGNVVTIKKSAIERYLTGDSINIVVYINPMGENFVAGAAPSMLTLTVTKHIHTPEEDDGDCTTPIKCSKCGFITTAAKTHNFTGNWLNDENSHWHDCQNDSCTVAEAKTAHSFVWITDKAATETENGSKHEECSVCGYKKTAVEIQPTGESNPKTGEIIEQAITACLVITPVGAAAIMFVLKKRKNKVTQ